MSACLPVWLLLAALVALGFLLGSLVQYRRLWKMLDDELGERLVTRRVCRERGHRWCHLIDPNRPWRQHCTRWGCHASRVNPLMVSLIGDWSE